MVSMKMSPEESAEYAGSVMADKPIFPWGLRITLDDESLKKLNMAALPAVDQTMIITCRVKVVEVSSTQVSEDDKKDCVGLQITDMELSADRSGETREQKLYGG